VSNQAQTSTNTELLQDSAGQLTFRDVFRIGSIRLLWVAETASAFGNCLTAFAVMSIATFQSARNGPQISILLVSFWTPLVLLGPFAGILADRLNVKWLMILAELARGFMVLALTCARGLGSTCGILACLGAVTAVFDSAEAVTVRVITPAQGLVATNGLMAQSAQIMQIIGPAIAAFLIHWFGGGACFVVDSLTYVISAAITSKITIQVTSSNVRQYDEGFIIDPIRVALKFLFTNRVIGFVVLSLIASSFALTCFSALLSIYVRDVLRSGTLVFGGLESLIAIGFIIGTQCLPSFARKLSMTESVSYGLAGLSLIVLFSAAVTKLPAAIVAMPLLGFCGALVTTPARTLIQSEVSPKMLGRISASLGSLIICSQMAAILVGGYMTRVVGIRAVYYGSSMILGLTAAIAYQQQKRIATERLTSNGTIGVPHLGPRSDHV
jgi:MFS family permease